MVKGSFLNEVEQPFFNNDDLGEKDDVVVGLVADVERELPHVVEGDPCCENMDSILTIEKLRKQQRPRDYGCRRIGICLRVSNQFIVGFPCLPFQNCFFSNNLSLFLHLVFPKQTSLSGTESRRAKKVARLASTLGGGDSLLTTENLLKLGFCRTGNPVPPTTLGEAGVGVTEHGMEASASTQSDMSKPVRTFVNPSVKYKDLFKNDDFDTLKGILDVSPISQMAPPGAGKGGSSSADKRKFSHSSGGQTGVLETRSSKRNKVAPTPPAAISQDVQNFYKLFGGRIPIEVISEWSKVKQPEAIQDMFLSSAQNYFHQLRISEQLSHATKGDMRLREELKNAKEAVGYEFYKKII
ncbi:hypothetical protein POM88_029477 [Heracleum sosnowskyi]|uniref:Uncharacterized protein n=1 Tax=Heracleum sosnowskyi TaxID=360622 RepID=A0AAD8HTQ7_9APIA|nr:hypothetical protein POM88_029477 [Heracleum sosnowskyi]